MNYLNAVFWDYPEFTKKSYLKKMLKKDNNFYLWAMSRFLEYGRVVYTFEFFSIDEIKRNFKSLKLSPYSKKKWKRLIEVYG